MNTELYIARRVFSQKGENKGIANRIVSISVASIAIGLSIMIIALSVLLGFKKDIREKVIGFGSHFQIVNYDANFSYETAPVEIDSFMIGLFNTAPYVTRLSLFSTKPGIIKTNEAIHPLVLKGVCAAYDWSFFEQSLVEGNLPAVNDQGTGNEVLISQKQANQLKLQVGNPLFCFFYNEGENMPRQRKYTVAGIYSTGFAEFDEVFVMGNIGMIQQVSGWTENSISGYELMISNFDKLAETDAVLRQMTLGHSSENSMLKVVSIERKYTSLFDWLAILDMNVWILLGLVLLVAGINMISGLLVIILERSSMIGILKSLGYPNVSIRKVFLYLAAFLSIRGLLWGNVIGIGLCAFQLLTGTISLDASVYYIDTVPVLFNFFYILLINLGTLAGIVLMVILPSMYISRISPTEAMRFQ